MRALKYIVCLAAALGLLTQCKDYLEVSNPGQADNQFVTSTPSEAWKLATGVYQQYAGLATGENYNFQDPIGSDAEMMGEFPGVNTQAARMNGIPIALFNGSFNGFYGLTARASRIAAAIEANPQFQADRDAKRVTEWTHMYGEMWTLWARSYFTLATCWGDVPYGYENQAIDAYQLTSRYDILDAVIAKLKEVEGMMWKTGEGGLTAERVNRTYANALAGEAALFAATYQTLRTDMPDLYGSVSFEDASGYVADGESRYARRTDWREYMTMAETYFAAALNNLGSAVLVTTDSRPANNPFQVHWQAINSRKVSPESIFESAVRSGGLQNGHPYSLGRPASNNGAFGKIQAFAAIRIIPTFLYTGYEDGDQRAEVSMTVTGLDASNGREMLIPFYGPKGSRLDGGGPAINKWDMNRGDEPNFPNFNFRNSGMNYTILKVSDLILMQAEAKAWLGKDAEALTLVNQVRARAKVAPVSGISGDAVLEAVYNERKLELLGEGDIRRDMIRSGKFNQRALKARADMAALIAGLRANNGEYEFPNGRVMSSHIYTKLVFLDGVSETGVTQEGVPGNPVLSPGWRGVYDWIPAGARWTDAARNLAIVGLHERVSASEAAALIANGYTKVAWGQSLLDQAAAPAGNVYDINILDGVVGRETKAPRYMFPLPLNIISQSKGLVTNGYGLPNE